MDGGFSGRFAVGSLATWRVTHLIAEEDGPADVVARLRAWAGDGPLGEAMDCFMCLSVWVSLPIAVAVARRRRDVPLTCLALSGAACLLEQATRERKGSFEQRGVADELLWQEAQGVPSRPGDAR